MKKWLASFLVCSGCKSDLDLFVFDDKNDETIKNGILKCRSCKKEFMIVGGIPRMLPESLYCNDDFQQRYKMEIEATRRGEAVRSTDFDALGKHKQNTISSFGWEWHAYD